MDEMEKKQEIHGELCRLGAARYKGLLPLIDVIYIAAADESRLQGITIVVFPEVAAKHHTTAAAIARNFCTIINACWKENREYLSKLMGWELKRKPTVTEFIAYMANHFSQT